MRCIRRRAPRWVDADWADAASGFITALGLRNPAVAGFSLGSVIALLLARNHPASVGRLVLVGAYAGWGGSLAPDALAERIAAARFTMEHPAESGPKSSSIPSSRRMPTRSIARTPAACSRTGGPPPRRHCCP